MRLLFPRLPRTRWRATSATGSVENCRHARCGCCRKTIRWTLRPVACDASGYCQLTGLRRAESYRGWLELRVGPGNTDAAFAQTATCLTLCDGETTDADLRVSLVR